MAFDRSNILVTLGMLSFATVVTQAYPTFSISQYLSQIQHFDAHVAAKDALQHPASALLRRVNELVIIADRDFAEQLGKAYESQCEKGGGYTDMPSAQKNFTQQLNGLAAAMEQAVGLRVLMETAPFETSILGAMRGLGHHLDRLGLNREIRFVSKSCEQVPFEIREISLLVFSTLHFSLTQILHMVFMKLILPASSARFNFQAGGIRFRFEHHRGLHYTKVVRSLLQELSHKSLRQDAGAHPDFIDMVEIGVDYGKLSEHLLTSTSNLRWSGIDPYQDTASLHSNHRY
ncbi:unnamed protein product [Polarella glacialis]|uniref:Uncharacterized protein n=1 Tax=Polarella glacialis TaxID=89957 RepID=A0A813L0T2_POLGL|nr:unnamed protein product [Polarella glacialis]CAE8719374.1 unnamed protein product [Polarella glacialis]